MGIFWLLGLLFFVPLLCFLGIIDARLPSRVKANVGIVFLALSSCLGDAFRARVSGFSINPRHGSYDHNYFRTMTNPGPSSSEHIELESMLNERHMVHDDERD